MILIGQWNIILMNQLNWLRDKLWLQDNIKKLWVKARITWICDRYGTVERGYLADYFTMFPNDWRRVKKMLRQRKNYRILYMLNKDVKNQHKHPSYDRKKSYDVCFKIRNSCFIRYYKCSSEFSLHNLNWAEDKNYE